MTVQMMQQAPAPAAQAQGGTFVPADLFSRLGALTRQEADGFDFGIVKIDDAGKILLYNQYESNLAGVPPTHAEGKSFFTQVAPCSNNGLFFGSFKKGVAAGQLNIAFPYTFTYKMKPTNVNIHLYRDAGSATNWIFVKA